MSIKLLKHVNPTNVTRLHFALETVQGEAGSARERLQQAIAWLEAAAPGRTTSERETCRLCQHAAQRLREQRDTPSPLALELRDNQRRFQAAQNGGPYE